MTLEEASIANLSTQLLKLLESNLESIPRQIWELTNGINLVRLLLKFFQTNAPAYISSLSTLSLDSCMESNYNKLSLVYYFVYLHGEFCKIILSYGSFMPNSTSLIYLINQLLSTIEPLTLKCNELTPVLENQLKLAEIRSEMNEIPAEAELGDLIRFGILMKFNSKMGLENRIFILVREQLLIIPRNAAKKEFGGNRFCIFLIWAFQTRNYLLYGSRVSSAVGFRLHGLLPLVTLKLESNNQNELPNSFSINAGGKILLLSAFTEKVH